MSYNAYMGSLHHLCGRLPYQPERDSLRFVLSVSRDRRVYTAGLQHIVWTPLEGLGFVLGVTVFNVQLFFYYSERDWD